MPLPFTRKKPRGLFEFHDGTKIRRADPFVIWRKLFTHPKLNFQEHLALAEQGQEPETTATIECLCEIFGVSRWDEAAQTGLTDWEILALVGQFQECLELLKKSSSPGQMPFLLSVLGCSTSPEVPDEPPKPSLDSGKTADELKPGEPTGS